VVSLRLIGLWTCRFPGARCHPGIVFRRAAPRQHTGELAEPVVEVLMFGDVGSGQYAFVSQGRSIKVKN
jgi:hypothetical protein